MEMLTPYSLMVTTPAMSALIEKEMQRHNYDEIKTHYAQHGYTVWGCYTGDYSTCLLADANKELPTIFLRCDIASELEKCTCTLSYRVGLLTLTLGPFNWDHPKFESLEKKFHDLVLLGSSCHDE